MLHFRTLVVFILLEGLFLMILRLLFRVYQRSLSPALLSVNHSNLLDSEFETSTDYRFEMYLEVRKV